MTSKFENLLAKIAGLTLLIVSLVTAIRVCCLIVGLHVSIPFSDEWSELPKMATLWQGGMHWKDMLTYVLQPHNEHWIAFSKMLYLIDLALFSYTGIFPLAVNLLMQGLLAAMLISLFFRAATGQVVPSIFYAALVLAMLFSLAQYENLVSTFQTAFIGCFFFAAAAVYAFVHYVQSKKSIWLISSMAAGMMSTLSLAPGIFLWICLAGLAQILNAKSTIKWVFAGIFTVLLGFYLLTYQSQASLVNNILNYPFKFVLYQMTLIGSIAGYAQVAVWLGSCGAAAYLILAYLMFSKREDKGIEQWALFFICTFVLLSGFLISLGRVSLGASQAMSSRYTTPMLIFWACLIASYWLLAYKNKTDKVARVGIAFVLGFWLFLVANNSRFESTLYVLRSGQLQVAAAITTGSYKVNPSILSWLANSPQLIAGQIDFLRANKLSLFSEVQDVQHVPD